MERIPSDVTMLISPKTYADAAAILAQRHGFILPLFWLLKYSHCNSFWQKKVIRRKKNIEEEESFTPFSVFYFVILLSTRKNSNSLKIFSMFFIKFFAGYMVTGTIIRIHPVSGTNHSCRQLFHNDLYTAFSRRNALMSDHCDLHSCLRS